MNMFMEGETKQGGSPMQNAAKNDANKCAICSTVASDYADCVVIRSSCLSHPRDFCLPTKICSFFNRENGIHYCTVCGVTA